MKRIGKLHCTGLAVALWCSAVTAAAEDTGASIEALRAEIAALRTEQDVQIAEIRSRTQQRIGAIEAALAKLAGDTAPAPLAGSAARPPASAQIGGGPASAAASAAAPSHLQVNGDFRLRYEANAASDGVPERNREVLRARLGARYTFSDWLTVGARLSTGDPDDPNSTDVTLSDFLDDLSVSLDQAWLRLHRGDFELLGGKMPNPFLRTELVWDGDVNPQGLAAAWGRKFGESSVARITGLHFMVNEQAAGAESQMNGLQLALTGTKWRRGSLDFAAAYYDYDLAGLAGADAGDVRSNLLAAGGGRYLSDFDLIDLLGSATIDIRNPAWPLKLTGNLVRNAGAATAADSAFAVDLSVGRAKAPRDFRFSYGYAVAETDAVLAAFSHDNTALATNYRQHTLAVDYILMPRLVLNATWYHYRLDDPGPQRVEWLDRLRINFLMEH